MSYSAQRVLDELMEYSKEFTFPITAIKYFFREGRTFETEEDYESLTVEEEKQVIKAFLEFAY